MKIRSNNELMTSNNESLSVRIPPKVSVLVLKQLKLYFFDKIKQILISLRCFKLSFLRRSHFKLPPKISIRTLLCLKTLRIREVHTSVLDSLCLNSSLSTTSNMDRQLLRQKSCQKFSAMKTKRTLVFPEKQFVLAF